MSFFGLNYNVLDKTKREEYNQVKKAVNTGTGASYQTGTFSPAKLETKGTYIGSADASGGNFTKYRSDNTV